MQDGCQSLKKYVTNKILTIIIIIIINGTISESAAKIFFGKMYFSKSNSHLKNLKNRSH